jgi:glucokinase
MVLAGDIGGTKVELALFRGEMGAWDPQEPERFPSHDYASLDAIVSQYIKDRNLAPGAIRRAAFGIAGPVKGTTVRTTNLPWLVEADRLSALLGGAEVILMNDLEANAWGIEALTPEEFFEIQAGDPDAKGNRALISAGTGLGMAGIHWNGTHHVPFASEGGHVDFAPRTDLDAELYRFLRDRYAGVVDWERVLCGRAMVDLHDFMRHHTGMSIPDWLAEQMQAGDPAAAISQAGASGRDAVCARALELFIEYYGAEAGNVGLTFLALGGVYIGGGIAPKILDQLKSPRFLASFVSKGRMKEVLESMPVRVILNPRTALLGSAVRASRQ